jgi:RNA polymerase sigma-70 factor (ECF subfamily)
MSDSSIIDLIKNGGQPALGKVYATYRSEFISWMTRTYPISEDDCKDIYQVTILIFYDNVRSGKLTDMASSIKTYLFGIGKNLARENMRKAKRITSIDQKAWLREPGSL